MSPYYDSGPSSPSESSSRSEYDRVPLVEENNPLNEKGECDLDLPSSFQPSTAKEIWTRIVETPRALVVATCFATTVLLLIVITSFTVHKPGSYVRMYTLSQQNALQPEYRDSFGGPMELGGTYRCGSYPSEAKSLGCVFDLMNFGWTAPECYYEEISTAGIAKGPYKFYLDEDLTVEIPQDVALSGRVVDVYTTRHYHREHCIWSQAVLALAMKDDNVLIPQVIAQQNHTAHCQHYVEESQGKPMEKVDTWTRVVYNSCIKLSEADLLIVV
ncbi:uncharacterized protein N7511_002710 [Penicillium nucicola]|uniref:uncharacterized protein n=1 Tax=Penicillium nucicola TaxID=1850975 RepID=UPI002544E585|nr:uncharacterized protein N7511_002710 [Penicillium nucicola]KAJ5770659.1 hypothetical protein N7511_002710 [Penicillium nucicola]